MLFQVVTYPFLFIALFFEVLLLVTFLSAPAKKSRKQPLATTTPPVAIIVPCYNEELTIKGTIDSLLALDYPKDKLSIVLVDDGSKDGTPAVMDAYAAHPQILVIHKENGGKHSALNVGIEAVPHTDFIGCLDADSFVEPDALREIIGYFDDQKVGAVTAAMSVHEPKGWIESMQNAEYIFGITQRHVLASMNGLYVTPGPFSFYRRAVVVDLGGFQKGHNTEDLEMALRLQRAGFIIENAPRARVYTKAPTTVHGLVKQRTRWTTGFLRNVLYDYRDLIGNPAFGVLGIIVLPLGLLAVFGGILIFTIAIYEIIQQIVNTYFLTSGIPVSYFLMPHFHAFEWFYLPVTGIIIFSFIGLTGVISSMLIGRYISKTPANLFIGIVTYILFFGIIAPLWLIRAVFDLVTGAHRSWR